MDYSAIGTGFRQVGTETTVTSVAGNGAMTKLAATLTNRSGVIIANVDATYSIRVRLVNRNATAPTYTNLYFLYNIPAGTSLAIPASQTVDVYVCNSSNAATTSTVIHQDFAY